MRPRRANQRLRLWPRATVWIVAVALCTGCARSGDAPDTGAESTTTPELLAEGTWSLVWQEGARGLLVRDRRVATPTPRPARRTAALPEVALYENGCFEQLTDAELVPLTLPGIPPERATTLTIARVRLDAGEIYFTAPGQGVDLHRSPVRPDLYVFEAANRLWMLGPATGARQLTADRAGDLDFAELAARQREGEVILYWATTPVWSPDARFVAYITSREAVADGAAGQAVWLIDVASGQERPLLQERGQSFRPVGWLGEELVYTGSVPGVWTVHPATGVRRQLALAVEMDVADNGSAVAVAAGAPEETTARVISTGADVTIPPPPAGYTYAAQAQFSPNARRLLLLATARQGQDRQFLTFDWQRRELRILAAPPAPPVTWPTWLDDGTILLNTAVGRGQDPGAWRLPIGTGDHPGDRC